LANHTLMKWSGGLYFKCNSSIPAIDVAVGGLRCCLINIEGDLSCNDVRGSLPLAVYGQTKWNVSHQLTTRANDGLCTLMADGQVTCSGQTNIQDRFRWGGHAMQPRQNLRRIIEITTNGVDAPYCGQKYFQPCRTINYAVMLIESVGPWIEFRFAAGIYELMTPIMIDNTGITLRGSTSGETIFRGNKNLIINAPSFRMINITFLGSTGLDSSLLINAGTISPSQLPLCS
jgi:hypothetical protein